MKNEPIIERIDELCIAFSKNSLIKEADDAILCIAWADKDDPSPDKKSFHHIGGPPDALIAAIHEAMQRSSVLYDIFKAAIILYEAPKQ